MQARWTKNEDIRLTCCLLDSSDPITEGATFLEYFRCPRTRADLDRDRTAAENNFAEIFNDMHKSWDSFSSFKPYQAYDPTLLPALHLPRSSMDVMRRYKGELTSQVKAFISAYKQSGRGRMEEWNFERHPVAALIYNVQPDLLQLLVGAIVTKNASANSPLRVLSYELGTPSSSTSSTPLTVTEEQKSAGQEPSEEIDVQSNLSSTCNWTNCAANVVDRGPCTELHDIAAFMKSRGVRPDPTRSSTMSKLASRKKQKLSDNELRLTLSTYTQITKSRDAVMVTEALNNLTKTLTDLLDPR